jgi:hypothetical protein
LGISLCSASIVAISHFAVLRQYGPRGYSSAFVIGRTIGTYVFPAIGVLLYYKISGKKAPSSVKFLLVAGIGVLWGFLALAGTQPRSPFSSSNFFEEASRRARAKATRTVPPTKWDPAIHSFFDDVRGFHMNYVAAVSKSETLTVPLYSPASFQDRTTVQEALSELHARLAISGEFSSPEKLLDKMPQYLEPISASEAEKKSFLAGFSESVRTELSVRKIVSERERIWAESAIALYDFALAHQNGYSIQNGGVIFKRHDEGAEFARKLETAQLRQLDFVNTYARFIAGESASFAQLGLPPLEIGGHPTAASSVADFLSHASESGDAKSSH